MTISYKKLWKLLIDRNMTKTDLRKATKRANKSEISSSTIAKLSKGKNVNTEVLIKICETLKCNISDIMDVNTGEEE